jgi:hypothetical protein
LSITSEEYQVAWNLSSRREFGPALVIFLVNGVPLNHPEIMSDIETAERK